MRERERERERDRKERKRERRGSNWGLLVFESSKAGGVGVATTCGLLKTRLHLHAYVFFSLQGLN